MRVSLEVVGARLPKKRRCYPEDVTLPASAEVSAQVMEKDIEHADVTRPKGTEEPE